MNDFSGKIFSGKEGAAKSSPIDPVTMDFGDAASEALSEALRMELAGTEIYVSVIQPGLVMTELHNHWEVHPKDLLNIMLIEF